MAANQSICLSADHFDPVSLAVWLQRLPFWERFLRVGWSPLGLRHHDFSFIGSGFFHLDSRSRILPHPLLVTFPTCQWPGSEDWFSALAR